MPSLHMGAGDVSQVFMLVLYTLSHFTSPVFFFNFVCVCTCTYVQVTAHVEIRGQLV